MPAFVTFQQLHVMGFVAQYRAVRAIADWNRFSIVDQDFDLPALAPASIAIHVDNDHSADETRLLIDYIRGAFNN